MSWPTTTFRGVDYWMYDGITLLPIDPSTGVAIVLLKPAGGAVIDGVPAIADGEPGAAATFQEGPIPFTELASGDPTPGGLTVTAVSPGVYALTGALHRGADGDPTVTGIDLASISGTAAAGQLIKVNTGVTGFDYAFEKVAERYLPGSINNTAAGNTNSLLCTIPIPAKNFDYRPLVVGQTIVTQNGGSSVVVDLVARIDDAAGGNIVARCQGIGGTERLTFASCPAAGSSDTYDKVTVAMGATDIHIRTEQQSGTNSYTTSNSTSRFEVWAIPVG